MDVIIESAKQIPALAVLVFLVVTFLKTKKESNDTFLKTLGNMDEAWRKNLEIRDHALQNLGDNCHAFQRDLAARNEAAFQKIVEALNKNTELLGRSLVVIERLENRLDGMTIKPIVQKRRE